MARNMQNYYFELKGYMKSFCFISEKKKDSDAMSNEDNYAPDFNVSGVFVDRIIPSQLYI